MFLGKSRTAPPHIFWSGGVPLHYFNAAAAAFKQCIGTPPARAQKKQFLFSIFVLNKEEEKEKYKRNQNLISLVGLAKSNAGTSLQWAPGTQPLETLGFNINHTRTNQNNTISWLYTLNIIMFSKQIKKTESLVCRSRLRSVHWFYSPKNWNISRNSRFF